MGAAAYRDLCAAAPVDIVRLLGLRVAIVGGTTVLLAPLVPLTLFNRAIGLGVHTPATEADVDAVIDEYRRAGSRDLWSRGSPFAEPASIPNWLVHRGFQTAERSAWAKMVRGAEAPPALDGGFTAREVRDAEHAAVAAVVCGAFGMPASFQPWFVALACRPGWRAFVALAGEGIVAPGFLFVAGTRAWLGAAGTLAEHRGRGAHRMAMAAGIRAAIAEGCAAIITETEEPIGAEPNPSLANTRRCGFRQVASRLNYALSLAHPREP